MTKKFSIAVLCSIVILAILATMVFAFGVYVQRLRIEPVFSILERIEIKGRRVLGFPTRTVALVDEIDTTFLRLRGEVFLLPDNDFKVGGGITTWGDDIVVMHQSGRIFFLTETDGLKLSSLQAPENGKSEYVKNAQLKYPTRPTRSDGIRYNDIEYIELDDRTGLAISYTFVDVQNECYRSRVGWLDVSNVSSIRDARNDKADWKIIFDSRPCLPFNKTRELIVGYMAGGGIAFKPPNLLYLGNGDYHLDGIYRPDSGIQSDNSHYGKTIEINLDTNSSRIFSKGHRNLQGLEVDGDGAIWATEHGMRGGDELNLIVEGENYGWPLENLGTTYSGVPANSVSGAGRHEIYRTPVYAWLPSAAISTVAKIEGFDPAWNGDLLVGSLRAKTMFRVRTENGRAIFVEDIPIGERIRDIMQVDSENIALWLDTNELVLLSIIRRANPLDEFEEALVSSGIDPLKIRLATETLNGCAECHSFDADVHGAGPSLHGIVNNTVAASGFSSYSPALRSESGEWTATRLTRFIANPESLIPGTTMTGLGVGDEDLAQIIVLGLSKIQEKQN